MLITNSVIFQHTHQLSDGTIVEHAHPFNKANDSTPIKHHHHSNASYNFFNHLSLLFVVIAAYFSLLEIYKAFITPKEQCEYLDLIVLDQSLGRAPPF